MKLMQKSKRAYALTMRKMVPSIFIAMVATGLGFLSLYSSPVPMIQDFGTMLTIGIVVSFIVALLVLLPLLFIRDVYFSPKKHKPMKHPNARKGFFYHFSKKMAPFKYAILLLAILTAGLGIYLDRSVGVETDIETFMPQDNESLHDIHMLRAIVGSTEQVSIVYTGDLLSDETVQWLEDLENILTTAYEDEIVNFRSILHAVDLTQYQDTTSRKEAIETMPTNQRRTMINDDFTVGSITIMIQSLETDEMETFVTSLKHTVAVHSPDSLVVRVTGQAVIDVEMMQGLTSGRYTITLLGMLAVFLGLSLIYRNPIKALTPLIPITLIVGWSGAFMYFIGIDYTPLTATLGALIIGIGTEFTILIMERYEQEKGRAIDHEEAMANALSKISKPILASALTTMGGFSALIISDFQILSNFGIMTIINLALALLSTLFIMPAVLLIQSSLTKKVVLKPLPSNS